MKIKEIVLSLAAILLITANGFAGNEQRAGAAGASELLINPWARSSGWGGANTAGSKGLESAYLNIAGTAFTKSTELLFCNTQWAVGTGININAFGLSQKLGDAGVLTLSMMSMNFGDIEITTVDMPEGGIGTYRPVYSYITMGFAKEFSNSIYGGLAVKVINEKISDLSASGVALDAGIQYVTGLGKNKLGKRNSDNLKFGLAMKNVGPTMRFKGDGMSFRGIVPATEVIMTVEQRSADFELPALITIGGMYDFMLAPQVDTVAGKITNNHRLSVALNFTSNSFTKDQFQLGVEYSFKEFLMFRSGFVYEKGIESYDTRKTWFTGPTAGLTVQIPINKEKGSTFSLDYSFRATNPFDGVHSIGARVSL
ncbi:MAG: hypothetical protein CVU05_01205 [Bacteroidetes bacterium HGW-Bacteroidetes-21]|jgi:hypothetical protein|nr:MAG: hypothetical protein CVU05_01205 [Bacteroidetes bacterium HGW-Bacteroidetes-21]